MGGMMRLYDQGFMVQQEITDPMKSWARIEAEKVPQTDETILPIEGRFAGKLGEAMVRRLCPRAVYVNERNHDFVIDDKTVEVKTKSTTWK